MAPPLYRLHFPQVRGSLRTDRDATPVLSLDVATKTMSSDAGSALLAKKSPGIQAPALVSSYFGSIDALFFMLPKSVFEHGDDVNYRSLLDALPVGTRYIVAVHESVHGAVSELFKQTDHLEQLELVGIPDHIRFTDWAEDAFVCVRDTADSGSYLLEPFYFSRRADSLIAGYVGEHTEIRAAQAPLVFQGGNCLVGDDFWLMGEDYFEDSVTLLSGAHTPAVVPSYPKVSDADVIELFKKHVDSTRRLIRVGTQRLPLPSANKRIAVREGDAFYLDYPYRGIGRQQPIFHIDMFITLVGRPSPGAPFRVLVGSPAAAAEITERPLSAYALQAVFDDIADQLHAQGFEVIRNPLAVVAHRGESVTLRELKAQGEDDDVLADFVALGAHEDSVITPRDWYHATHNNCLVQVSAKCGNHVYLPTFGNDEYPELRAVDECMRSRWTKLEFKVHSLNDFHAFARRLGVVHCIKKYLARRD